VNDRKVGIETLENGSDLILVTNEKYVDAVRGGINCPANNFKRSVVATHRVDDDGRHSDVRLLR
jgi:hypothetical protein